ncbi:nuclear transport factor 2 family protein [Pseudomonadota bacterium]
MKIQRIYLPLVLLMMVSQAAFATDDASLNELDAVWAEVSRTVAEGDFEGYKATYHEDAILVSGPSQTSYLIEQAFDRWEQGFVDTRAGKIEASVEFRFTQRFNDAETALETGMFYYSTKAENGERTDSYAHFEALLIKKDGWKMMMEYQKSAATQAQWDAAR